MLTEAMQSFSLYKIFDVVNREYKIKEIVLGFLDPVLRGARPQKVC